VCGVLFPSFVFVLDFVLVALVDTQASHALLRDERAHPVEVVIRGVQADIR
jgi:hypothetical protein